MKKCYQDDCNLMREILEIVYCNIENSFDAYMFESGKEMNGRSAIKNAGVARTQYFFNMLSEKEYILGGDFFEENSLRLASRPFLTFEGLRKLAEIDTE